MQRRTVSLDGPWSFYPDPGAAFSPESLEERPARILEVPGAWQALAEDLRSFPGPAWYRRSFQVPPDWLGRPLVLTFGAVDDRAEVWVNGKPVGHHEGGYLPFELDITEAVRAGENWLVVRVEDSLENFPEIPHGKQSWYGLLSGIWQPVGLESRPAVHLLDVQVRAVRGVEDTWEVKAQARLNRPLPEGAGLRWEVLDPAGQVAAEQTTSGLDAALEAHSPQLWDLDSPALYSLRVVLEGPTEDQGDEIRKTFGFRTVEARDGRFWLNGRPVFLRGALDQDYYPETICTPPSIEYLEDQFRKAKALGLNCLRIHIKIPDPRYYEVADRLGLLVWTELPNWQTLTPAARRRAEETLTGMVARDGHHPSIVIWTLINESWGVDLTDPEQRAWVAKMFGFLKALDPDRPVVGNSACWGNFQVVTDIEDFHNYYAMPDHYRKWRHWVRNFAARPDWVYAHEYQDYRQWRRFMLNPWQREARPRAAEVQRRGDAPLMVSEFGNWGLPDLEKLHACYDGEPWWFETGAEWGEGVVYPHGVENRFRTFHMERAFGSLAELTRQSQWLQFAALKYQIEQIRRQDSLTGFVITEFTDVHWESNGLLDFCRNPKVYNDQFPEINGDDLIIPDWSRLAYWEGELCRVDLSLSHYSQVDLAGSRLKWRLEDWPEVSGELPLRRIRPAGATRLGTVQFEVPALAVNQRARLELELVTRDGRLAARSWLDLFFFARRDGANAGAAGAQPGQMPLRLYAPELAEALSDLGYPVVDDPAQADAAIALTLTDDHRRYMLAGGRVLWLAEADKAQQTYLGALRLKPRHKTLWQGDWASSMSWICREAMFAGLPSEGLVDFLFAGLTPNHVFTGLKSLDFAHQVHAGLAVGWLHRPVALIVEQPVGRGRLLACSFKLSRSLTTHPVAASMLDDMLHHLRCRPPKEADDGC